VDPAAAGIPENRRNEYWGYMAKFNPHMAVNWDPKKERFFSNYENQTWYYYKQAFAALCRIKSEVGGQPGESWLLLK
jgi:hypothetical protein